MLRWTARLLRRVTGCRGWRLAARGRVTGWRRRGATHPGDHLRGFGVRPRGGSGCRRRRSCRLLGGRAGRCCADRRRRFGGIVGVRLPGWLFATGPGLVTHRNSSDLLAHAAGRLCTQFFRTRWASGSESRRSRYGASRRPGSTVATADWSSRGSRANVSPRVRRAHARVAEWQTRRLQVPVPARAWRFNSSLAHGQYL